jgi:hypothetical protein
MKKFSVSLLAVLAILFAVTSAFTTTSSKKSSLDPTYSLYGNPAQSASPTGAQIFAQNEFLDAATSAGHAVNFTDGQVQSTFCPVSANPPTCAVVLEIDGTTYTIKAVWFGSYTAL